MSLKNKKIHILTILFKNISNSQPQLVPSADIAGQMNVSLAETKQVLKSMEGMGVIETDPDLQYNLITQKGLLWLDSQIPVKHMPHCMGEWGACSSEAL